jgi:hypothetical protein
MIRGGLGAQRADSGRAGVRAVAGSVVSDGSAPVDRPRPASSSVERAPLDPPRDGDPYTTPPGRLFDLASAHGLFAMAGIAWEQDVAFLDRGVRRR